MSFQDLLARIQQQPEDADYHSLRMAYARSPEYAPYVHDLEGVERLRDALQSGDLEAALLAVGRLLSFNYLDIEAHMAAGEGGAVGRFRPGDPGHPEIAKSLAGGIPGHEVPKRRQDQQGLRFDNAIGRGALRIPVGKA